MKILNNPSIRVRHIKLGVGNAYADRCIRDGTMILGFWSGEPDMFDACRSGDWHQVESLLRRRRATKNNGIPPRSVKDDLRQVQEFFSDVEGKTVWITFAHRKLYWGMSNSVGYRVVDVGHTEGVQDLRCERPMTTRWSSLDKNGRPLGIDDLPDHLTKVNLYNGTICGVRRPDYVLGRIKAETDLPEQ